MCVWPSVDGHPGMDQWNVDDNLYGDFASNTAMDKKGDTNGKLNMHMMMSSQLTAQTVRLATAV